MQTIQALTVRDPLLRKPLGVPPLSRSTFSFDQLRFPLIAVEVPHQYPAHVQVIHSVSELAHEALEALAALQCTDADIADREVDSFSDAELLEIWSDNLFALHLIEMPASTDYRIELPPALRHNFPWSRVEELIADEVTL